MAFPTLLPAREPQEVRAILQAVSEIDAAEFRGKVTGDEADDLFSEAEFDGLEINPSALFKTDDQSFEASGTVYVRLPYGGGDGEAGMTDSYAAVVKGKVTGGGAEITGISIDTSSLFR